MAYIPTWKMKAIQQFLGVKGLHILTLDKDLVNIGAGSVGCSKKEIVFLLEEVTPQLLDTIKKSDPNENGLRKEQPFKSDTQL